MEIKVEINNGVLAIFMPIEAQPKPSASGKTIVVATTHGNVVTSATYDGKPIVVGVNAYVKR